MTHPAAAAPPPNSAAGPLLAQAAAARAASTALAVYGPSGQLIWANDAWQGLPAELGGGRDPAEDGRIAPQASAEPSRSRHEASERERTDASGRHWLIRSGPMADGRLLVEAVLIPPPHRSRRHDGHESADLDPITGLLTRRAAERELGEWFASRRDEPFALLFLDVDRFKQVNDRFGHVEGDRCLRQVADRIASVIRVGDIVGRWGGDEFVVLLDGVTGWEELRPVTQRLRAVNESPLETVGGPVAVGVSAGAAFSQDGHSSAEEMLREADLAMYRAKGPCGGAERA